MYLIHPYLVGIQFLLDELSKLDIALPIAEKKNSDASQNVGNLSYARLHTDFYIFHNESRDVTYRYL